LRRRSDQQHQPKYQIEVNGYDGDYDDDDYDHDFHDK
jgi:hypothetical protein